MSNNDNISKFLTDTSIIRKVQYVLIGLFMIVVGLDIYLALDSIDGNTISNIIKNKTDNGFFVLTYFWGAIASNFFLYDPKSLDFSGTIGSIIVILFAILIIIFDIEQIVDNFFINHQYNISIYTLSMSFGLLVGWLFWRQKST